MSRRSEAQMKKLYVPKEKKKDQEYRGTVDAQNTSTKQHNKKYTTIHSSPLRVKQERMSF